MDLLAFILIFRECCVEVLFLLMMEGFDAPLILCLRQGHPPQSWPWEPDSFLRALDRCGSRCSRGRFLSCGHPGSEQCSRDSHPGSGSPHFTYFSDSSVFVYFLHLYMFQVGWLFPVNLVVERGHPCFFLVFAFLNYTLATQITQNLVTEFLELSSFYLSVSLSTFFRNYNFFLWWWNIWNKEYKIDC